MEYEPFVQSIYTESFLWRSARYILVAFYTLHISALGPVRGFLLYHRSYKVETFVH